MTTSSIVPVEVETTPHAFERWRLPVLCGWRGPIFGARVVTAYLHIDDGDRALANASPDEIPVPPDPLQRYLADHSATSRRLHASRGFVVLAQSICDCNAYAARSS
jgi:hypothetical protein